MIMAFNKEPLSLEETLRKKEQAKKFDSTYDSGLGFKPEDFDEIVESLKAIVEKITQLKEEGYSQDEINAQIVYEMLEDDLHKKRAGKRKTRAEAIIQRTLEELQAKGVDTSRLEEQWFGGSATPKKEKTAYLSSYQSCIKTWFDLKKRMPSFGNSFSTEISREKQKPIEELTEFELAVAFCKKHHKELDTFIKENLGEFAKQ